MAKVSTRRNPFALARTGFGASLPAKRRGSVAKSPTVLKLKSALTAANKRARTNAAKAGEATGPMAKGMALGLSGGGAVVSGLLDGYDVTVGGMDIRGPAALALGIGGIFMPGAVGGAMVAFATGLGAPVLSDMVANALEEAD